MAHGPQSNPRQRIYLDHAATSFPKPPSVMEAMTHFASDVGVCAGRGSYAETLESGRILNRCRDHINRLINGQSPAHVVFTLNCTDSLNIAIRSLISPGRLDHIITTHMAHNSVLRPFNALVAMGDNEQTRVACDPCTGLVDPDDVIAAITPITRLVVLAHASNVTGTLQPLAEIGRACRERDIAFIVDAAQTMGHVPIDVRELNIDLLAFPGHKGLLGPLGTGGLYVRPGLERQMHTVREGGTGSFSELDTQPEHMPDKFEPGSHNAIGIAGLAAGVEWILKQGVDQLWTHERQLIERALARFADAATPGILLIGPTDPALRCGVFSIRVDGLDPAEVSSILEDRYNILTRSGLHCAPLAHKALGTFQTGGTTRLSFGPFTTEADVDAAADALREIGRDYAAAG